MGYIITEEMLEKANDTIPTSIIRMFIGNTAPNCFQSITIGGTNAPVKPMVAENSLNKRKYLLNAFLYLYFGIVSPAIDPDSDPWLVSDETFDEMRSAHIFNQLERLKSKVKPELRGKIFDILSDYKEFEKAYNTEIYGMLQVANDSLTRTMETIYTAATPENMQKLLTDVQTIMGELEKAKAVQPNA